MDVFITYRTDDWHSIASREMIGIYSTKRKAMQAIKKDAKIQDEELEDDDIYMLNNYNQTQSRNAGNEYEIEQITLNNRLIL